VGKFIYLGSTVMGDDDAATNYVKPVVFLKDLSETVEKSLTVTKVKAH